MIMEVAGMRKYHVNYGWGDDSEPVVGHECSTIWYTIDDIHLTFDPNDEYLYRNIQPDYRETCVQVRPTDAWLSGLEGSFTIYGGPYCVMFDIVIPAGVELTIKPGCRIYFAPGHGITVHGVLRAEGRRRRPVRILSLDRPHKGLNVTGTLTLQNAGRLTFGP